MFNLDIWMHVRCLNEYMRFEGMEGITMNARCLNACKVFESKCVWINVLVLECIDFLLGYILIKVWMNVWLIWFNNLVCILVVERWCTIGEYQWCVGGISTMPWHDLAKGTEFPFASITKAMNLINSSGWVHNLELKVVIHYIQRQLLLQSFFVIVNLTNVKLTIKGT